MVVILKRMWISAKNYVEKYPVAFVAIVIYTVYFLTTIDLFEHVSQKRSFFDFVLQFDSLIFLGLAAAAFLQLQKYRKEHKFDEERRKEVERILDRQQIYKQIVNDVTMLLQDNVNNPLAIISVTVQELKRKYDKDEEMLRWIGRIETSVARINDTMRGLKGYESEKMFETTNSIKSTHE